MSLQDKVPEKLRLSDSIISITSNEDVGVFPTSEYVLLEISPTAEKINVPKIASTIHALVRNDGGSSPLGDMASKVSVSQSE